MSLRSRIDQLEESIGVGKLWDGTEPTGHLPEDSLGNASYGQNRRDLMMAVSTVAMHWLLEPDKLRARQAKAPTAQGRQGIGEMIALAKTQAQKVREMAGVEAGAPIDQVITGLLERCKEEGFTFAELQHTRKQMEAFVQRAEQNRRIMAL